MSDSASDSDLAHEIYDPEDDPNYYGSPIRRSLPLEGPSTSTAQMPILPERTQVITCSVAHNFYRYTRYTNFYRLKQFSFIFVIVYINFLSFVSVRIPVAERVGKSSEVVPAEMMLCFAQRSVPAEPQNLRVKIDWMLQIKQQFPMPG
jgi:hypothetical protein